MWYQTMCYFLHLLLSQVVTGRQGFCVGKGTLGPPEGELQGVHCVVAAFWLWTHTTQTHVSVYPLTKVRGQVFTIDFLRKTSKALRSFCLTCFTVSLQNSLDGKFMLWCVLSLYYYIFTLVKLECNILAAFCEAKQMCGKEKFVRKPKFCWSLMWTTVTDHHVFFRLWNFTPKLDKMLLKSLLIFPLVLKFQCSDFLMTHCFHRAAAVP